MKSDFKLKKIKWNMLKLKRNFIILINFFIDLPADLEIHNILIEISNRIFRSNDSELLTLIKKSIVEAAKANTATTKTSIEAGAKKAQRIVTDVTAAYTQATFRANTAQEVREILLRFQNTVQLIIDYAKNGQFAM